MHVDAGSSGEEDLSSDGSRACGSESEQALPPMDIPQRPAGPEGLPGL